MTLTFRVYGTPAPQGSKRHVGNGVMVESSAKVKPWRQDVKHAALDALPEGYEAPAGPVAVRVHFTLPRPRSHYGTGRNAATVKPGAPEYHSGRPDVDKLLRSTLDALTAAGVLRDDNQVAALEGFKWYGQHPGAHITVNAMEAA